MFSQNIQSLIDTSGKEAAVQRVSQIANYVNGINRSVMDKGAPEGVKPFAQVLKSSNVSDSRFNVTNSTDVQAAAGVTGGNKTYSKAQILNIISDISKKYDIDENLVKAVVRQESGFRHNAVSSCGALGLMQLMPSTARGLGVVDPFDPAQNIEGGVKYLKAKLKKYNGNLILALAAYNAGSGNVDKYGGVPPFKETQNYVKNILAHYLG